MIAAIVAVDGNWGIGYQGDLLIKNKVDMTYFKNRTVGHKVFVGRKTYESFPKRPLEKRANFVITRNPPLQPIPSQMRVTNPPIYVDMDYVKDYLSDNSISHDDFIIGGGNIYKELLPYCDTVYVTFIGHKFKNVDTYFPNLETDPHWELTDIFYYPEYQHGVEEYDGEQHEFKYDLGFAVYKRIAVSLHNTVKVEIPEIKLPPIKPQETTLHQYNTVFNDNPFSVLKLADILTKAEQGRYIYQ